MAKEDMTSTLTPEQRELLQGVMRSRERSPTEHALLDRIDELERTLVTVQEQLKRNYDTQLADAREEFRKAANARIARVGELEREKLELHATIEEWRTRAAEYARQLQEASERTCDAIIVVARLEDTLRTIDSMISGEGPTVIDKVHNLLTMAEVSDSRARAAEARAEVAERDCKHWQKDYEELQRNLKELTAEHKFTKLVNDFNEICRILQGQRALVEHYRDVLGRLTRPASESDDGQQCWCEAYKRTNGKDHTRVCRDARGLASEHPATQPETTDG